MSTDLAQVVVDPRRRAWDWACCSRGSSPSCFPVLAGLAYMAITRQLFSLAAWKRLHLVLAVVVALVIAAAVARAGDAAQSAVLRILPACRPGEYRGFFWFYFFNEHLLRFLNLRYPRDYNTVPRLLFWALNLVWLFPWSVYLLAAPTLSYTPTTRAGRARLMAVCWIGVVMVFFTFSTTQEYYSMPIYPALALLIGSALAAGGRWIRVGSRILLVDHGRAVSRRLAAMLAMVWRTPARGRHLPGAVAEPGCLHALDGTHAST